jgi:hypothetical protein
LEHPASYRGCEVAKKFQARRNKLIQDKSKERAEKVPPQVYQQVTTGKIYVQSVSNPVQPSTSQKEGSSIEELLLTIMSQLELTCTYQSSGKPTYWPTDLRKIPDLLDFFIIRNRSTTYVSTEENFDLVLYHTPVILTMSENVMKKEPHLTLVNKNGRLGEIPRRYL